jgi:hypothetical protein
MGYGGLLKTLHEFRAFVADVSCVSNQSELVVVGPENFQIHIEVLGARYRLAKPLFVRLAGRGILNYIGDARYRVCATFVEDAFKKSDIPDLLPDFQ